MSADDFSELPKALQGEREKMPWEQEPCATRWQWGLDAGKLLTEIDSRELLRKRRWLEWRNGSSAYFQQIIGEIDAILLERMGE